MFWTILWPSTIHEQQNIFEKVPVKVGSSYLYASFGTFCVQIGQWLEAQWVFEKCLKTVKMLFLKENEVDSEFFWTFKISLRLEWLTNLNAECTKRSVKIWAINYYKNFLLNILMHMNGRWSKIRSVHTYEVN